LSKSVSGLIHDPALGPLTPYGQEEVMRTLKLTLLTILLAAQALPGAELKRETLNAFDEYVRNAEAQIDRRVRGEKSFLWLEDNGERLAKARSGDVMIDHAGESAMTSISGGLIHDWIGGAFVPGASLEDVLAVVQDYDNHERFYKPEVTDARLIKRDGNDFHIYYRLLKKKVITVVLDTEHDVRYFPLDENRLHSRSYTTRVSEVKSPGTPKEVGLPDGEGGGYLWRLNSYWRFAEREGGVYVELRAISLTRRIPTGLGWLVKPIVKEMPRISMEGTLTNTRDALLDGRTRVARHGL
jgi:hypothetical protein